MKASKISSLMAAALILMLLSTTVYAATSDRDIEDAARNTYTYKTYLKDDDIRIQVKDGIVTLTGTVAEQSHKSLAEETVANLPGVKRADNNLEIKEESSPDFWLMTKVKTTLLFQRNVSVATNVNVEDGVVTLRGVADNQAQKELTGEYALDIEGVTSVNNEMTVNKPTEEALQSRDNDRSMSARTTDDRSIGDKIDDASITALVKTTLLSHRSTSGLQTKVTTKDGVVTLSGIADNDAEKSLAAKLAGDVKGVESVDNQMTVNGKIVRK